MNNIIITKEMYDQVVPKEFVPKRFDSATNLLACVKDNSLEGVLVYNINPDIWKTWYPYYNMVDKFTKLVEIDEENLTYGELIGLYNLEYYDNFENIGFTEDVRNDKIKEKFISLHDLNSLEIKKDNDIAPVYELKYSKSTNMWTLYRFESTILIEVDDKYKLKNNNQYDQNIYSFVNEGTLEKLAVTSNLIWMLTQDNIKNKLKKYIIDLDN